MSRSCTTCKKAEPAVKLKNCSKCSSTPYCSRDCQKADWKAHRKICGKQGAAAGSSTDPGNIPSASELNPPRGLDQPIAAPFTRLDNGTWLHDRPEKDVYRLLIDAYRMRVEDDYKIDGDADVDSIYGGASNGLEGFRRFLREAAAAAAKPGLLPSWWGPEKQAECEKLGRSGWSDLSCAIEKSDVIEHYGDPQFPMQLRMFAESVYGSGPGGADGSTMRKMLAMMESGAAPGMSSSTIDMTTMGFSHMRV